MFCLMIILLLLDLFKGLTISDATGAWAVMTTILVTSKETFIAERPLG